jgi:hypothetical protein
MFIPKSKIKLNLRKLFRIWKIKKNMINNDNRLKYKINNTKMLKIKNYKHPKFLILKSKNLIVKPMNLILIKINNEKT